MGGGPQLEFENRQFLLKHHVVSKDGDGNVDDGSLQPEWLDGERGMLPLFL